MDMTSNARFQKLVLRLLLRILLYTFPTRNEHLRPIHREQYEKFKKEIDNFIGEEDA